MLAFSPQRKRTVTATKDDEILGGLRKRDLSSRRRKVAPAPSVVVLAAGTSSRFGTPKQVAMLGGKTLLERVVDSIPVTKVKEVVVVAGRDFGATKKALGRREKVRVVVNPTYALGMST